MAGLMKSIRALFGEVEMAPYDVIVEHEVNDNYFCWWYKLNQNTY